MLDLTITPVIHDDNLDTRNPKFVTDMLVKEAGTEPLLTQAEEVALFKLRDELRDIPVEERTRTQKRRLEQVKDKLVNSNLLLVISIAKKYLNQGVPFDDLYEEGVIGLMKASDKFEWQRGYKFSTYASWWIRQAVSRAVADQGRTIRIPVHLHDKAKLTKKVINQFMAGEGREPTVTEIAPIIGDTIENVEKYFLAGQSIISMDESNADDDDDVYNIYSLAENGCDVEADVHHNLLSERLSSVLETLSPRKAKILQLRFGLNGERPHTLEEVGQKFGLTRERIRQIEGAALRELRHPRRSRKLKAFMD